MPRIRYLKPNFFKDEHIAELPHWVRLLYQGLWVLADKAGRLHDRPRWIKAEVFPYEELNIEEGLKRLSVIKSCSCRPFIIRYKVRGENYIEIVKWEDHQKPHHTEKDSSIPAREEDRENDGTEKEPQQGNGNRDGDGKGDGECSSSELGVKEPLTNGAVTVKFEEIWKMYPKQIGRTQALEYFKATVKTDDDFINIRRALENYLVTKKGTDPKYIKTGANWFSDDWKEWVNYREEKCPKCGGKGTYTSSNGYTNLCPLCKKR